MTNWTLPPSIVQGDQRMSGSGRIFTQNDCPLWRSCAAASQSLVKSCLGPGFLGQGDCQTRMLRLI